MAKKSFKVGYMLSDAYGKTSEPCVRFGGQWLKDFGINTGDRLELIQGKNMLVLVKVQSDS
jgi:hypothetical protein